MKLAHAIAPCLALAVLWGCGATPASSPEPLVCATPEPSAAPTPAPGGSATDVRPLLAALQQTKARATGIVAKAQIVDTGPAGHDKQQIEIYFKKPSTLHIRCVDSENGQARGSNLLWDGGGQVKVKPSFLFFPVSMALDDANVVSKNGWPLSKTDVNAILGVLLDPSARIVPLGQQTFNGTTLEMLEVHSGKSPEGVTRDVIGVDPVRALPRLRQCYVGTKLAYQLTIQSIALKVPTSDQLKI